MFTQVHLTPAFRSQQEGSGSLHMLIIEGPSSPLFFFFLIFGCPAQHLGLVLNQGSICAPCLGSSESQPLDHQEVLKVPFLT